MNLDLEMRQLLLNISYRLQNIENELLQDWVLLSEIAKKENVSVQAIHQRVQSVGLDPKNEYKIERNKTFIKRASLYKILKNPSMISMSTNHYEYKSLNIA